MRTIAELYSEGLSCDDVAERIGVCAETVRKKLKAAGIPRRSKAYKKPKPVPSWDEYFRERSTLDGECILWTGTRDKTGYGRCSASFARTLNFAHRLSWFLTYGPFDERLRVLHECDMPSCVNPNHLFLGTQADNVADMCAKDRQRSPGVPGTKNGMARLSEHQVLEIRLIKAEGVYSQAEIARRFGVSPMTISRAVRGEAWRHV